MNLGNENETVEFKKSTSELKEGIASIAAMLNKHGSGTLYFGVKNNGDVCGLQVSDVTLREIGQAIDQSIEPRIHPTIESLIDEEGNSYIHITFNGTDTPYSCKGIFRSRVSDSDIVMSAHEVRRMAADAENRVNPWDRRPSGLSLDDIDEATLQDYIKRGNNCGRITFAYDGKENTLVRLGLMNDGLITNAAGVLFSQRTSPILKMGIFANHERIDILDIQQERGNLFQLVRKAEFYVLSNIRRRVEFDGSIERIEIPELPMEAVREAIINAFTHRSYRDRASIQIEIYPDSVEILSPGWFPVGHTPEEHLQGNNLSSQGPNELIAEALFRSKDIESFATGMPRMQKLCNDANVPLHYEKILSGTKVVFGRPDPFASSMQAMASNGKQWQAMASICQNRQESARIGKNRQESAETTNLLDENELKVYIFLQEKPNSKTKDVVDGAEIKPRTAASVLLRLIDKGLVIKKGAGKNTTYSLVE